LLHRRHRRRAGLAVEGKPLLYWLLKGYCSTNGIDIHEIDPKLSFRENKTLLQDRFGELRTPGIYRRLRKISRARRGTRRA